MRHEKVTPELMNTLRSLISLAPLHLPGELKGIDAIAQHYPGVSQTAMFRHRFPQQDAGDRKVAGHCSGASGMRVFTVMVSTVFPMNMSRCTLKKALQGRVIIAHLGNGASMAALKNGRSQDTTMGISALGGLMMGTRSGDLDPGILLCLMDRRAMTHGSSKGCSIIVQGSLAYRGSVRT